MPQPVSLTLNASSKVVFRLSHSDNLKVMAEWLFMGVMNPDEIKHELYSTKVMEYREEIRESITRSKSTSEGGGAFSGLTGGKSAGGTIDDNVKQDPNAWNEYGADSEGDSSTWTSSESESVTESSVSVPIMGKELAHVQFRSLDEQKYRAMAVLFDQQQRQGVARLVGMSAPVSLYTPEVNKMPASKERTAAYLAECYEKLPFALPHAEAQKQIADRAASFSEEILRQAADEPASNRRRLS